MNKIIYEIDDKIDRHTDYYKLGNIAEEISEAFGDSRTEPEEEYHVLSTKILVQNHQTHMRIELTNPTEEVQQLLEAIIFKYHRDIPCACPPQPNQLPEVKRIYFTGLQTSA